MIRVMLVDDHPIVQIGFQALLAAEQDLQVVATPPDGEAACRQYQELHPDVLVMDLSMPGMGGLEAMHRILSHDPKARILILSTYQDAVHCARAINGGATGYLSKRSAPERLAQAIRQVYRRQRYLDPDLPSGMATGSPADLLSRREFEVFLRLAAGENVQSIADALFLSTNTVGTHLYNIKQKLNATNQSELTLQALHWGLLENKP